MDNGNSITAKQINATFGSINRSDETTVSVSRREVDLLIAFKSLYKHWALLFLCTLYQKQVYQALVCNTRYCQMLWIEVWIGKGLSDFLQHTIFKFHVLGHKVKLFKAFQSSPTFFCLPAEFKSHGFCGLCRSVALC